MEVQFGFKQGRVTRKAILTLRMVTERRIEKGKQSFLGFVYIENVNWEKIFKLLKNLSLIHI